MHGLFVAEVHEHYLCGLYRVLGVKVELVHDIIYAVGTERDTYSRYAFHTEHACKVVVSSSTCDAAYRNVKCLHFEDCACVIVEAACQCQVKVKCAVEL